MLRSQWKHRPSDHVKLPTKLRPQEGEDHRVTRVTVSRKSLGWEILVSATVYRTLYFPSQTQQQGLLRPWANGPHLRGPEAAHRSNGPVVWGIVSLTSQKGKELSTAQPDSWGYDKGLVSELDSKRRETEVGFLWYLVSLQWIAKDQRWLVNTMEFVFQYRAWNW